MSESKSRLRMRAFEELSFGEELERELDRISSNNMGSVSNTKICTPAEAKEYVQELLSRCGDCGFPRNDEMHRRECLEPQAYCKHCGYRLATEDHRLRCGEDTAAEKRALRRSERPL